jgi:tRNA (mo5U34)-methyltransferase
MAERVTQHNWWHTIELTDGTVTPGGWDLRPTALELPWPDVAGKRCLDVGTADGFWAFELERRGAADVVAIDLPSAFQAKARARFALAAELLGSGVAYEERSVYGVEGTFDVVVMGFVLQMVSDPLGALRAIRSVPARPGEGGRARRLDGRGADGDPPRSRGAGCLRHVGAPNWHSRPVVRAPGPSC